MRRGSPLPGSHRSCSAAPTAHSSCCSASTMPTSRMMAAQSGKMPTTSLRRRISRLRRSWGLLRPDLPPVLDGERGEGGDVGRRPARAARRHPGSGPRAARRRAPAGPRPPPRRAARRWCAPGWPRRAGRSSARRSEQVAHEVRAAALPAGPGQRRVDCPRQALVVVGDHEPHAGEAARDQAARKAVQAAPSSLVKMSRPRISRWPSALTRRRDHAGDAHDAPPLTGLDRQGVEPR